MKRIIYISMFVLISLLGWFGSSVYSTQSLHKEISVNEVSEIKLWGYDEERKASNEEKIKIISWFNNATDIRRNKNFAGSTPYSGIIIQLNSEEKSILISRSGEEFEVQRDGISYWAKESNIKQLLDELAKE